MGQGLEGSNGKSEREQREKGESTERKTERREHTGRDNGPGRDREGERSMLQVRIRVPAKMCRACKCIWAHARGTTTGARLWARIRPSRTPSLSVWQDGAGTPPPVSGRVLPPYPLCACACACRSIVKPSEVPRQDALTLSLPQPPDRVRVNMPSTTNMHNGACAQLFPRHTCSPTGVLRKSTQGLAAKNSLPQGS